MQLRHVFAFMRANCFAPVSAVVTVLGVGVMLPFAWCGAQSKAPPKEEMDMEVPHGFFTHEGLPDPVGSFSLRTTALSTRTDGKSTGDFAFHLETGLTKRVGLHIRNDRFLNNTRTEAMFQFVAISNESGTMGFAPIIEFEFPTRSGGGRRIEALVGQTAKVSNSKFALNEVVHYNPREDGVDWSASLVAMTTPWLFPVAEVLGSGMSGNAPALDLLAGVKVRIRKGVLLGFAYRFPVTTRKDFTSQLVFQPDFDFKIGR